LLFAVRLEALPAAKTLEPGISAKIHDREPHDAMSDIVVATGRTPNTDRLDAAKAGVELDRRGYLRVNDWLQTTAPDVWATGECAGSTQFTHVGEDDCRIVLDILAAGSRTTRGRLIPYCLVTDPELAHVGLTESEAHSSRVPYRIARMPMAMVLWTHTLSEMRGFMRALISADDRILGFTAFWRGGERANGGRPDGNARRHAVHGPPRHDLDSPDRGRGIARPVRKPSVGARAKAVCSREKLKGPLYTFPATTKG
jgi:pyruvate/2-oxoglutarate dehydrogenase complex dihydrolipoamide dehydrogenase (E3) component